MERGWRDFAACTSIGHDNVKSWKYQTAVSGLLRHFWISKRIPSMPSFVLPNITGSKFKANMLIESEPDIQEIK